HRPARRGAQAALRMSLSGALAQPPPPARAAGLRRLPLLAQRQAPVASRPHDALRMGVAAPPRVPFGRDQHMLAEGRQQMTTQRTAIRRWLSIGGSPHRPPWRTPKRAHRTIVAP